MKVYDDENRLNTFLKNSIDNIKILTDSNTIIGDPIVTENCTIIPISKMSIGFVVGGGEYSDKSTRRVANHYPMAGGTGGGVSLTPMGFLIDYGNEVKYVNVEDKTMYQTILNLINKIINKIGEENENQNENDN